MTSGEALKLALADGAVASSWAFGELLRREAERLGAVKVYGGRNRGTHWSIDRDQFVNGLARLPRCRHDGCRRIVFGKTAVCRDHVAVVLLTGRSPSENAITKNRKAHIGKQLSLEHRQAISEALAQTKIPRACEQCGEPFDAVPSRARDGRGRFCSKACHRRWRWANDRDYRARVVAANVGRVQSPEYVEAENAWTAKRLRECGLVGVARASSLLGYSAAGIRIAAQRERAGLPIREGLRARIKIARVELASSTGKPVYRYGLDARAVATLASDMKGTNAAFGALNAELAAKKGTVLGPTRKLEDGDALTLQVLKLRAEGHSSHKIAAIVGVSQSTVSRFLRAL